MYAVPSSTMPRHAAPHYAAPCCAVQRGVAPCCAELCPAVYAVHYSAVPSRCRALPCSAVQCCAALKQKSRGVTKLQPCKLRLQQRLSRSTAVEVNSCRGQRLSRSATAWVTFLWACVLVKRWKSAQESKHRCSELDCLAFEEPFRHLGLGLFFRLLQRRQDFVVRRRCSVCRIDLNNRNHLGLQLLHVGNQLGSQYAPAHRYSDVHAIHIMLSNHIDPGAAAIPPAPPSSTLCPCSHILHVGIVPN